MKKIIVVISVCIVVLCSFLLLNFSSILNITSNDQSVVSGPFTIKSNRLLIDENVFLIVDGLKIDDIGEIVFITPNNKISVILPVDGKEKNSFSKHFTPDLSRSSNICTVEELIGEWTIKFRGMDYEPIKFEIINEYLPDSERYYEPVC